MLLGFPPFSRSGHPARSAVPAVPCSVQLWCKLRCVLRYITFSILAREDEEGSFSHHGTVPQAQQSTISSAPTQPPSR